MKATGIIRRIDDLGRVVIPREIRRTMKILEGDPLEIYTDGCGVYFKKYDHKVSTELQAIADGLREEKNFALAIAIDEVAKKCEKEGY